MKNKISVVVPIYKNENNIIPFYNEFMTSIAPEVDDYEIIMVNDYSPDNSWEIMCELSKKNDKIKLIRLSRNFGAISASFIGLSYSTGDCATVKACDLQEPSKLVLDMYREWISGNKAIIAVRNGRDDGIISNSASNLYYFLVRRFIFKEMPVGGFDAYLIDRSIINKLVEMNDKNSPITLQLLWMGFSPKKVYYTRKKREIGKSSWTFAKKMKLFIDSFVSFSYFPIRFMSIVGLIMFILSILLAIKLMISRIKGGILVEGYTTTIVVLLLSMGLIMFTLGILGEYIWRILDNVRNRPIALVEEKINFDESGENNEV